MPNTTCSVCRRPTPVEPNGAVAHHLRIYGGRVERCPGGK